MEGQSMRAIPVIALAAAVLAAASNAGAQEPNQAFDAYVAKAVQDWQAPGLAIAVVKDGRIVFAKGYGVREVGKPEAFDTSSVCDRFDDQGHDGTCYCDARR
jgi:CubicO group peptidase (beta-lactamase class C family)